MSENALDTLKRIREGLVDPKEVSILDRRTCVAYLRSEGYTQEEIAEIFNVHRVTIARDEKTISKELAKLVDEIEVKAIAGDLIAYARHLTAKAIRQKDYSLAWKIKRELIYDLQSLGYLPKAPEQHQLQISTFVDLIEMANKQIKAEVIEPDDPQIENNNENVD